MKQYSFISVYDNEGQHFGTDRRYTANLDLAKEQISYCCSGMSDPISMVIASEDFDDIITYLNELLNDILCKKATVSRKFSDENRCRNWMRGVDFSDRDVAWAVTRKLQDGRIELYLSTASEPVPVELDALEKVIKDLLNIEEGVTCYAD